MAYLHKVSSLEEKASVQVAINLCQEDGFKEVAMCLEKPTYGSFVKVGSTETFVSDPEILSEWTKMKEDHSYSRTHAVRKSHPSYKHKIKLWDAEVNEQCQRLTEGLSLSIKNRVHAWINRIALEYSTFCRRQEVLFGVSRYYLMDILTRGDWTETGRLDEQKVAQRLLIDERLTVLQRYCIACVYCLHIDVRRLWQRLTDEEKNSINWKDHSAQSQGNRFILLWSCSMVRNKDEKHIRTNVVQLAVSYGNRAVLMLYWKRLEKHKRQKLVIDMAISSLRKWQNIQTVFHKNDVWKEILVSTKLPFKKYLSVKRFNLPFYYSELLRFFLSEMHEKQQLQFFKEALRNRLCESLLDCFLDWPLQDDFLPMVNRLWGIVPKDTYAQCLLTLASKCTGSYDRNYLPTIHNILEDRCYDYRSLLWSLWEKTPEDYKRYLFQDKTRNSGGETVIINEGKVLLLRLLERSLFQERDETLFKRIFLDLQQEERTAMMRSEAGENICSTLTQNERWSFVNWILVKCFPKEEIPSFKKQFIQSNCGRRLSFNKLQENCEKLLEDLINWSFELDTEKTQFKHELVDGSDCLHECKCLLLEGKFTEVERMINFCLPSDEMKVQFKRRITQFTYGCCSRKQVDKILAWGSGCRKEIVHDQTSRECGFLKDKCKKRLRSVKGNESSLPRKHLKEK